MRAWRILLIGSGLLGAVPSAAQIRPQPGTGDPRIQSVEYKADQVVLIEAAPGYQVTIELAPDEQIENVALGDSSAWQATANRAGNHLFVKPLQAGVSTNMTVVTNVRPYAFDLNALSNPSTTAAYIVQFRYASSAVTPAGPDRKQTTEQGLYEVRGARALIPTGIEDDGVHTYIEWAPNIALPAVYVLGDRGRETLANGNMRDGLFVIDSVAKHLVFRIDKQTARADRLPPRKARP